jgi:hypothetical protein
MEEKEEEIKKPVCPYCKCTMTPFNYTGYYDSFSGWDCDCEDLPDAEDSRGPYV